MLAEKEILKLWKKIDCNSNYGKFPKNLSYFPFYVSKADEVQRTVTLGYSFNDGGGVSEEDMDDIEMYYRDEGLDDE